MKVKSSDEIISDVLAEQYDLADIEEYRWKKNELRLDPIHKTASRYMTAFTLFGLILLSLWLVPMGMMAIAVHPDSNVDILTA